MTCTVKMSVTAQQFFDCIEDQLLLDIRMNNKKNIDRSELREGFQYTKMLRKEAYTVSIIRYDRQTFIETQEEGAKKLCRTLYSVEELPEGKLSVRLETKIFAKPEMARHEQIIEDTIKDLAAGRYSWVYRLQLKSLERYIKKNYAEK